MNNKSAFNVSFPIELFTDWVKERGVNEGAILDHQEVSIESVDYTTADDGWLNVKGSLESRIDS